MRAFIAADIPEETVKTFPDVKGLKRYGRISPVRGENIHITLFFLGEIDEDEALIAGACMEGAEPESFAVNLSGVSWFTKQKKPSVVFVEGESERLSEYRERLGKLLHTEGFSPDKKPFVPHATLARVRSIDARKGFMDELQRITEGFEPSSFTLPSLTLYRSDMNDKGVCYTPLKSITLS
ncbi:RNA 2',3'-cyclic phosphodiesterase [Limisalsivibrio acetivorans]|uniref:RNA 2',3'-cyclic phosphodiesterase n=1 Tax=Limisalsivibrio acetivorans TaxID=1304888 RepID=UPI0003B57758|nr:RNA 2',3'-cyclic phosphodiesterase [Limisalsivibrio acetivorans]